MMVRKGLLASAAVLAAMLVLSLWALPHLPADGRFATHWNIHGQADGFGGRAMVLWLVPGLIAALASVLALVPFIDPRRKNLLRSSLPYLVVWSGVLVVLGFAHVMMVLNAVGAVHLAGASHGPGMLRWVAVLAGAFMAVTGAVMGKMRPNWFMGLRTPWTLSSDLAWDKTHRLAGRLFMLTGLATVVTALVLIPRWAFVVLIGGIGVSGPVAIAYSWMVWKNDPARETLVPDEAGSGE